MRVVIAPDKFKGTLTAIEAAQAMADGARDGLPGGEVVLSPITDGGEGTLEIILQKLGGRLETLSVKGPLNVPAKSPILFLENDIRLVEMAAASGLHLIQPNSLGALTASSYGTGESIRAALEGTQPGTRVVLAIGGSATTDGGTGAATVVGWRFLAADGSELEPGGGALIRLSKIVPPDKELLPPGVQLVGACDVVSPLLGPTGAARGFAAQKGAAKADVDQLEEGLEVLAERIQLDLGIDAGSFPGSGAGGGMGMGVVAFFGGELASGFDLVADLIGLSSTLAEGDLVVTGEGRIDRQTLAGKTALGVARRAGKLGVPVVALAGAVELDPREMKSAGFSDWMDLSALEGEDSFADPAGAARRGATELLQRFLA